MSSFLIYLLINISPWYRLCCCTDKMAWTVAGKVFSEEKVRDKRCRISKGHYVCMLTTLAFLFFFFFPCLSVSWIFINHLWYFFSSHGSLFHLVICAPLGFFFFSPFFFCLFAPKKEIKRKYFPAFITMFTDAFRHRGTRVVSRRRWDKNENQEKVAHFSRLEKKQEFRGCCKLLFSGDKNRRLFPLRGSCFIFFLTVILFFLPRPPCLLASGWEEHFSLQITPFIREWWRG